jgi:hypothetical protein
MSLTSPDYLLPDKNMFADIPKNWCRPLTIFNVNSFLPDNTCETYPFEPIICSKSFCFNPFSSSFNFITSIGSGAGI